MQTQQVLPTEPFEGGPGQQSTPGATVVGWIVICFALIPVSMVAHGDGRIYAIISGVMMTVGLGLLAVGRLSRRRRNSRDEATRPH